MPSDALPLRFLQTLSERSHATALVLAGGQRLVSHGELAEGIEQARRRLEDPVKGLIFCAIRNAYEPVVEYLAALASGHAVALIDPSLPDDFLAELVNRYQPHLITGLPHRSASGYERNNETGWLHRQDLVAAPVHPRLCLLLATSGTTGSPKFVRLSYENVDHNAYAIAAALAIGPADRAVGHLPFHYSFGMSVLHSHLAAGASVLLLEDGIVSSSFWASVRNAQCTSIAGTPYHHQVILRLGFERLVVPRVNTLTQAGGRLDVESVKRIGEHMQARNGRFYVMYGQTEASPRMAVLPPDMLWEKLGSVGRPLQDGSFAIADAPGAEGEVIFRGPNVMMGYASDRSDLASGDAMGGVLTTGDLGRIDADGYLYITGRLKRIAKIAGMRLSLDDIERLATSPGRVAAIEAHERIVIFVERDGPGDIEATARRLAGLLRLGPQLLSVREIDEMPVTASGKPDYRHLRTLA